MEETDLSSVDGLAEKVRLLEVLTKKAERADSLSKDPFNPFPFPDMPQRPPGNWSVGGGNRIMC